MNAKLRKLVNILFTPYNTLIIGAVGVLLSWVNIPAVFITGYALLGVVTIIVIISIIVAWYNVLKKKRKAPVDDFETRKPF